MHLPLRIIVSTFLLTSVISGSFQGSLKPRRDGILHLYPFPRVGRASRHTWEVPVNDIYSDYEPGMKRQLYAFPRVGRGEPAEARADQGPWVPCRLGTFPIEVLNELLRSPAAGEAGVIPRPARRADSDNLNIGMWNGPRIGRAGKRDEDDITVQNGRVDRSDPEQMEPVQGEREKRQIKQN